MTRNYLVYLEWMDLIDDDIADILCDYCGYHNIFKINMVSLEEGFAYAQIHIGGGRDILESMKELKQMMRKKGANNVGIRAWSMHQDESTELK